MDIDRIFRIDNQLVSVDFLVKDRNLLIKYWNPRGIESLSTKENFKQKAYEKYRQDWTQIAARHELNGGKVYLRGSVGRTDDRRRTRRLHEPRHPTGSAGPARHVREELTMEDDDSGGWQRTSP